MFVKLTSGFLLPAQLIRNLVLQDFSVTGSKSCKLEVTFAIHQEGLTYIRTLLTRIEAFFFIFEEF